MQQYTELLKTIDIPLQQELSGTMLTVQQTPATRMQSRSHHLQKYC